VNRFVLLSGCSGGGKSTLLAALGRAGHAVVEEPGRRIVAEERAGAGRALPWVDLAAFARRAFDLALADRRRAARLPGRVFFDRGLVDAAAAFEAATGDPSLLEALKDDHRYHPLVFLTPPWPGIFRTDGGRRHGFDAAVAEYQRLAAVFPALGYETVVLARTTVAGRVRLVLDALAARP
jgi:Predicted ATPase